jgi:hypothetical protein
MVVLLRCKLSIRDRLLRIDRRCSTGSTKVEVPCGTFEDEDGFRTAREFDGGRLSCCVVALLPYFDGIQPRGMQTE